MAGFFPHPQVQRVHATWPRNLHRGAVLLAVGGLLYWSSFVFNDWTIWIGNVGAIYVGLLVAWVAVLINVAAWPALWDGLRDLVAANPRETSAVMARRAFLCALGFVATAVVLLPLQYHAFASTEVWLLVLYISAFPFLVWTFVPTLALHGILFGRVANFLDAPSRRLTDIGSSVLFAVAAATTIIVLQNPDAAIFVRSWSVGQGMLPAATCIGYALVAAGLTFHPLPEPIPLRGWAAARTPRRL